MSSPVSHSGKTGPPAKGEMNRDTIKQLLQYMKPYKAQVIFVCICIVLSAVANVSSSLFIQRLIDDYIQPLLIDANPVFTGLLEVIMIMACIYFVGVLSALFFNRTMAVVSQSILKTIRDQMFAHMQKLPIKYFDSHTHGDVMSYYTNDTDTLRQMLSQSIPQMFSSLITVIAVFCGMMYLSIWLTLFVVVFLFIVLRVTKYIGGKSGSFFVKQQKSLGDVNGYIEEMVNGQKVVKVFCHEEDVKADFDKKNDELCTNATKANAYANILMPVMNSFGYMLYVFIAILGGTLAIMEVTNVSLFSINVLTLGMIASFLQLSRNFVQPISQMSQQVNAIAMAMAGAERIFQFLSEQQEADEGYVTLVDAKYENGKLTEAPSHTGIWAWKYPHSDGTVTYTKVEGNVVFDDVDFGYEENKIVLRNISLNAEPGEKIAFVGATGAGKTTITNLINRFYDIADGKIRYDGININKIKKADLRRSLGMVLQDVNLFTGTVMENLRYGNLKASDEDCIAAAKLVNADGFIRMLPDGYNTVLSGDGSGLSQGQRQLISIARAAVADPPVMILDEATSSIDTRTEAIVQHGMDALMKGRTVFVIAHRLSTVRNSDDIMVLDQGRIIERGNHEKLIAEKGKYYQLYTGAFELD
ncbi:ABC transporter ATP-binding protein [Bacillus sp. AGMB 02131]|uniref:ABC transporter ATP-binding protein n=1 Tax=Peribacillus faecalis TaxID=2772559 RepID=A0A927CWH5_9BACI|nr:ABC transporter ATP-binding protein [Peribacillus faecalis]MBD3108913.1 ABC transporter ATP-binding protein [Peribacillus faecalis]